MLDEQVSTSDRSELTGIIRDIRNRWRVKLAVRGAAFVVGGFVLTLLLSAYALETLKFSPGSIIAFRVFDIIYVMTGGGPGNATTVLAWLAFQASFVGLDFGTGNTYAYVIAMCTLGLSIVYIRALYARGEIRQ